MTGGSSNQSFEESICLLPSVQFSREGSELDGGFKGRGNE